MIVPDVLETLCAVLARFELRMDTGLLATDSGGGLRLGASFEVDFD